MEGLAFYPLKDQDTGYATPRAHPSIAHTLHLTWSIRVFHPCP
jgi:hypothetical protein